MAKRGNNEGTITKRADGRWEARLTLEGNKRKCFYGKTRQEVARKLAAAMRDVQEGLPIVAERQTVEQYLTAWLDTVRPTIRESTWIRYEQFLRKHAIPELGKMPLAKLTPQHLQALYAAKAEQSLSPTTINHLHGVLHHALRDAERLTLVQRNVSELVDPPRVARRQMQVFTPEQARAFREAVRGHRLEALFVLALTTGMREGELLALKWKDVDLDSGLAQVRMGRSKTRTGFTDAEPKTRAGRRRVALPPMAIQALRAHRTRQLEERLAAGEAWQEQDVVFASTVGTALDESNVVKRYYALLKQANLPRIRFHDLRHTAATLLLLQGVPAKVVSEMLGHASIAITLDLYSHVLPDMQQAATSAMERVFAEGL